MNSIEENLPNAFDNQLMKHDDSYHFNSSETESAAFTTLAASSFSMRSCVIVNMEPVMLMDATPDPTYVASDNPLGVSSLSICMKINAKLKFRPKNIS